MFKFETDDFNFKFDFIKPNDSQLFQIEFRHGKGSRFDNQKCMLIKVYNNSLNYLYGKHYYSFVEYVIAIIDNKLSWLGFHWESPELKIFCEKILNLYIFI